jgi:predicted nucleic acid-binding protein
MTSPPSPTVYLDTCSLQRPLDTQSHPRIHLEAEAVLVALGYCESGAVHLVSSEALAFEISRIPDEVRRVYALEVLAQSSTRVETTELVVERARVFQQAGIRPLDALHLSSAVEAETDFFCTCDDKLLKRARLVETGRTKAVTPLELVEEIDRWLSS